MWSMAGITLARYGVAREKKAVASLKSYTNGETFTLASKKRPAHLENVSQLLHDLPFTILDFIFSYFHVTICTEFVVGVAVCVPKIEHFVSVVPTCRNIPRHYPFGQWFLGFGLTGDGHSIEDGEPFREDNGRRILDSIRGLP